MEREDNFHTVSVKNITTPLERFCSCCGAENFTLTEIAGRKRQRCGSCGHIVYKNPVAAVGVMVVKNNYEVLLGKINKPNTPFHEQWSFINGFVEYDQSFVTAAVSEVIEESGLQIEVESLVGLVSTDVPTLAPILKARALTTHIAPQDDELSDFLWIKKGDMLPSMAFLREKIIVTQFFSGTLQEWKLDLTPYKNAE